MATYYYYSYAYVFHALVSTETLILDKRGVGFQIDPNTHLPEDTVALIGGPSLNGTICLKGGEKPFGVACEAQQPIYVGAIFDVNYRVGEPIKPNLTCIFKGSRAGLMSY